LSLVTSAATILKHALRRFLEKLFLVSGAADELTSAFTLWSLEKSRYVFRMDKKLFLLDGMALVYRAHFALIARPILTSKGVNTSALYGFTQTLLEILKNQQPSHLAVAFDTEAPTHRHAEFKDYKATRQAMPEDLSLALPHVTRMLEAFRVPVLTCDGYEADDIIGTLVRLAEKQGFKSYMVTPDKDFGQLIDENTFLYKPSRMGDGVEVLGVPEIQKRWGIQKPDQVVDVLALMGDSSDNIPGVPGIGEKTAIKLIGQFGTVENLLARTGEVTGKLKENLEKNREVALLSKRLATILCDAPCPVDLEALKVQPFDEEKLKALLGEFEFNSIGRRLFGEDFKAGRGFQEAQAKPTHRGKSNPPDAQTSDPARSPLPGGEGQGEGELSLFPGPIETKDAEPAPPPANLKRIADVPHDYQIAATASERKDLILLLNSKKSFALKCETINGDAKLGELTGLAFSLEPQTAWFVPLPSEKAEASLILEEFRPLFESTEIGKTGYNLKFDLSVLKRQGMGLNGKLFDAMIAHSLIEPDMRHALDYISEVYLGYAPLQGAAVFGDPKAAQLQLATVPVEKRAEYFCEQADLALQLREKLEPLLKQKGQEQVFYEIESPLMPVLVAMEHEGIRLDASAMAEFGSQLAKEIELLEKTICHLAGSTFNISSPKQLGQVLFEVLKICEKPKKTRTGQYATDEQTLAALAPDHEIVRKLMEHRVASKLKSTYADALPAAISPGTGRIHTTYNQVATSTGRLNSQDPNLQNIPIRSERGQEIRKAFVPRDKGHRLLSADYSQIELRIIAALSREAGLLEAFRTGADVHTATAARVYNVFFELVTPEMRRKAKMVNYGIAYGISAFGLAQRLGIPRREAAEIIEQYFKQFSGIRSYMDGTMEFARKHGYVETVTGRRRYMRDINSSNATVRGGAERNAINAPIQGTAADMIKIAMINIHRELSRSNLKTRMLLQVHDELVFDLYAPEEKQVREIVEEKMKTAIRLEVPIEVEIGVGQNWLEAH
jgi:DNA polymerase I